MHKLITYKNGLRLIVKRVDYIRSVTAGVWVGAGSSYESLDNNGISHFIEHMMFKGTKRRTAFEIADSMDSIGAQINAFTSKECTCYYTRSTDEHTEKCFDVLSDMLYNSKFDEDEAEKEKKVVLEEISMVEDAPEDSCHELLARTFFKGSNLARPILGTPKSVRAITKDKILSYMNTHYCPDNIVISIVGHIEFEEADRLVRKYFDTESTCARSAVRHVKKHSGEAKTAFKKKAIEQANIAYAFDALHFNHEKMQTLILINNILGGGMSSRLFQRVREQQGLAYSVYSYVSAYAHNGMFAVYCGTNPTNASVAAKTILDEIKLLRSDGITQKEFTKGKEQMKGSFILAQENTSAVMNVYGKQLLLTGEIFDLDGRLNLIKGITFDDCNQLIQEIFDFDRMCLAVIAKTKPDL